MTTSCKEKEAAWEFMQASSRSGDAADALHGEPRGAAGAQVGLAAIRRSRTTASSSCGWPNPTPGGRRPTSSRTGPTSRTRSRRSGRRRCARRSRCASSTSRGRSSCAARRSAQGETHERQRWKVHGADAARCAAIGAGGCGHVGGRRNPSERVRAEAGSTGSASRARRSRSSCRRARSTTSCRSTSRSSPRSPASRSDPSRSPSSSTGRSSPSSSPRASRASTRCTSRRRRRSACSAAASG